MRRIKVIFSIGVVVMTLAVALSVLVTSCSEPEVSPVADATLKAAGDCGWCGSYPICCGASVDPDGDGWGWEWSRTSGGIGRPGS